MANNHKDKSAIERIGGAVSSWVSDIAANPIAQVGVIVLCGSWFALGLNANILTAVLSVLAISLTQMVLNRQNEREAEAHRRDVAMHAKLDELVIATRRARNEMVGIEEDLDEDEIVELKQEAKVAIDEAVPEASDAQKSEAANKAAETAAKKLKATAKPKKTQKKAVASGNK
jgi:low affinity Fe/Cu permease